MGEDLWLYSMDTEIIWYHLQKISSYMHDPNFYKLEEGLANSVGFVYVKMYKEYISRQDKYQHRN